MRYYYIINRAIRLYNLIEHNHKQCHNSPSVNYTPSIASSPVVGWLTVAIPSSPNNTDVSLHYKEFPQSADVDIQVPSLIENFAKQHKNPCHRTGFILSRVAAIEANKRLLSIASTREEKSSNLSPTSLISTTQEENPNNTLVGSLIPTVAAVMTRESFSKKYSHLGLSYSHEYSAGVALLWKRNEVFPSFVSQFSPSPSIGTAVIASVDIVSINRIDTIIKKRPTFVSRWLPHLLSKDILPSNMDNEVHNNNISSSATSNVSDVKHSHVTHDENAVCAACSSNSLHTTSAAITNGPSLITVALHWSIRECVVKILGENNRSVCMKDCSVVMVDRIRGVSMGIGNSPEGHLSHAGQHGCKETENGNEGSVDKGVLEVMFDGCTLVRLREKGILYGKLIVQWETVVTPNETLLVATAWAMRSTCQND
eukprot:Tbor_TRINITY_DN4696_c0_g1::TRINITY_DN4696_c0_g1_i1::g.15053::m.15053